MTVASISSALKEKNSHDDDRYPYPPDQQAVVLKAKATAQGLTLEDWISERLKEGETERPVRSPQEAAAHIRELQRYAKPDPEGWTVRDYINFGCP